MSPPPDPRVRPESPVVALAAFVTLLALAGCTAVPAPGPQEAPLPADAVAVEAPPPEAPPAAPEPVYGNFEADTLYELLVAEMALRRGEYEPALERYGRQAELTRDPGVVAKAAQLAAVGRREDSARELALLWAEVAPREPGAHQAAAVALVRAGDFEGALVHLGALRRLGAEAGFGYLAVNASDVEPEARAGLLTALDSLQAQYPDDDQLAFARAVLLERDDRPAEALVALDRLEPDDYGIDATLLRGRLLEVLGDEAGAVEWLRAAVARGGETGRLRYTLARLLVDVGDLDGAREQFERILARVGDNAEILLSLALITMETDRLEETFDYLERLLASGRRPDSAHYYLGVARDKAGDVDAALDAWSRVTPGFEYRRAQGGAAALALESGGESALRDYLDARRAEHPDEARMLWLLEAQTLLDGDAPTSAVAALDAAIDLARAAGDFDADLFYARAMAHDRAGDLAGLERDLRTIIDTEPDNAMALNALGYTLGDRTERLGEARELVERALELAPDDPAYIDSLGWIEYRAGNLDRAVTLLEQAFDDFANHEVAAHLGEALWALGEAERAREVWIEGLTLEQPTPVLTDTVRRLLGDDGLEALEAAALDSGV